MANDLEGLKEVFSDVRLISLDLDNGKKYRF
jgi:hypothetical protein